MLRASAHETDRPYDLAGIVHTDRSTGLDAGEALVAFADTLLGRTTDLETARNRLVAEAGADAAVRAAAVAGNFQMMNRLVDATGVPIGATMRAIADDLELDPADPKRD